MTVIPLRRHRHSLDPGTPAFGACEPLGWRRSLAVVLSLAALLGLALYVRVSGVMRTGPTDTSLPPLLAVATVAPGVLRGGEPSDIELLRLRDSYGVRAVVDVDAMDVEEKAVTGGLGLRTLDMTVTDRQPPTAEEILRLVRFLRSTAATRPGSDGSGVVYMHDIDGRGPILVVTAMLQLLRGVPLSTVLDDLRAESSSGLSGAQLRALHEVDRVVRGIPPTRAYSALRGESW
jgi:hypothetical protein